MAFPIEDVVLTNEKGGIIPRLLDKRFYNPNTYQITPEGIEYFNPIFNDMTAK